MRIPQVSEAAPQQELASRIANLSSPLPPSTAAETAPLWQEHPERNSGWTVETYEAGRETSLTDLVELARERLRLVGAEPGRLTHLAGIPGGYRLHPVSAGTVQHVDIYPTGRLDLFLDLPEDL